MENVSVLVFSPGKGQKFLIDLYFKPLLPHLSAWNFKPQSAQLQYSILHMGSFGLNSRLFLSASGKCHCDPFGVTLLFPSRFLEKW